MNKILLQRLTVDLFLFISVIFGWWLVIVILSIFALVYFKNYIEVIIFGILFDVIFGFNEMLGIIGYIGSIYSITIYATFYWLKSAIRK